MPTGAGHLRDVQGAGNSVEERKSTEQKSPDPRDRRPIEEDEGSQGRAEEVYATGQEAEPREELLPGVRQALRRPQAVRVERGTLSS